MATFNKLSLLSLDNKLLCEPFADESLLHKRVSCISQPEINDKSILSFISLESHKKVFLDLMSSISDNGCVLIEGESGCGKTYMLDLLTRLCHKEKEVTTVHLGDQIDSKTLLGTFTCSDMPGEFIWAPGILTKAVIFGQWIIFEDIDFAPVDIISLLLPLIKTSQLIVPGYTDPFVPAEGFKIFATRRLSKTGIKSVYGNCGRFLSVLENHVTKLHVPQYSKEEIIQINLSLCPDLDPTFAAIANSLTDVPLRKLIRLTKRLSHVHRSAVSDVMLNFMDVFLGHLSTDECYKIALDFREVCGGLSIDKLKYLCYEYQRSPRAVSSSDYNIRFAHTRSSLSLLDKIETCVRLEEPVLLVGETGLGKTAVVSYLAAKSGKKLISINLSQQTDSADLLGGFKPVQISHLILPVKEIFKQLLVETFNKKIIKSLSKMNSFVESENWKGLTDFILHSVKFLRHKSEGFTKHVINKTQTELMLKKWKELEKKVLRLKKHLDLPQSNFAFDFIEGGLVEAVRKGWWVLLDEVNLASPEALQCLCGLLEGPQGTFVLTEKVDGGAIVRDNGFRLFSCMNPATDINKRSLPINIRNRFSEFYVDDVTDIGDLRELIKTYIPHCSTKLIDGIINFYLKMREKAKSELHDGTGRRPHYSLRTLCRSLQYDTNNTNKRSLYEGLLLSFYSQLCQDDHPIVSLLARKCLDISESCANSPLPEPTGVKCVQVEGYWVPVGSVPVNIPNDYILTPSIRTNLTNLARIISGSSYPILLQGPTSAGKTSLVQYLAKVTGHRCLRINNHEHTDLQEYIGMYSTGINGTLEFNEGVLVKAMREGYWIILDELNLAPTDVLEALNRVLDDNRELYIPETQQLVKAHPHFRLFGTQNPPGAYGGRKLLSRAFRNRFIELHYDDIPPNELIVILFHKCSLPKSYAEKMVSVMKDLQQRRSVSGIFEGKYGLITLRDLFRWAERYRRSSCEEKFYDWEQLLAEDGFMLLAGRLRTPHEEKVIIEVLQKYFKKSTVDPSTLFNLPGGLATHESLKLLTGPLPEQFRHLVWTPLLLRMGVLVHRAITFDEPVLLVGTTGCGKTTLCQLIVTLMNRPFYSINCHMHSEAGDFLGGLRPVRNRIKDEVDDTFALFEWCDGMLVKAMRTGGCVLIDEISLADDAVLERLNSVLEPERRLLVAERGTHGMSHEVYEITAEKGFLFLATMNPGGDYGKKELSPALRNRFVEIWCPDTTSYDDYKLIIDHNIKTELKDIISWSEIMVKFISWIKREVSSSRYVITVRDILLWVEFMNKTTPPLSPSLAFFNGAEMIFIDSLGCNLSSNYSALKKKSLQMLKTLCEPRLIADQMDEEQDNHIFGIHPFYIKKGTQRDTVTNYCLTANGPSTNLFRLLRGLQLGRPLLLEGDPGVGKTSLVSALAISSGHILTRINLSEHTDISDLFGSDLPVEGKKGILFEWRDGPFLKALRNAEWILLDEMNLASQSVLEGLNACLDHRGEIYIPELCKTFSVPCGTRLFACQNPFSQGGGRKGLPRSFINRFTQVYMEPMSCDDFEFITSSLYPQLSQSFVKGMVSFNNQVQQFCDSHSMLWEFNLRDILRWCEIMKNSNSWSPGQWVEQFYIYRLRDNDMREKVMSMYKECIPDSPIPASGLFHLSHDRLQIGATVIDRDLYRENPFYELRNSSLFLVPCQVPLLRALLQNVIMNWMTILVGPGNSGKSSLVHILASLTGHRLLEYHMNSNTDTMELLGGFEQVNFERKFSNLISRCVYLIQCIKTERKDLKEELDRILVLLKPLSLTFYENSINDEESKLTDNCFKLKNIMESFVNELTSSSLSAELEELLFDINSLLASASDTAYGQFEWVDSLLVTAMTQGYWLVITQANFCSPSVLDRLNPLMEPNGSLSIDERGVVNGFIPTITPHKNFRLFLTMDASHGEISRAMRNRGIEITLLPQDVETLHLQLSRQHTSFLLNIQDLLSNPVESQVKRDLQPLIMLVDTLSDDTDISFLLHVTAQLRVFLDLASINDMHLRYEALVNVNKKLGTKSPFLRSIIMAMADVLIDENFVALSNSIAVNIESIIGAKYDSHINVKVNSLFYEQVESSLSSLLNHLQLMVDVKFLMYLQKRMITFSSFILFHSSNLSINKDTVNIINQFLAQFTSLLSKIVVGQRDFTMSSLAVDSLKLFIYSYYFTGSSHISMFAIAWSFFKQYCLDSQMDIISNDNILSSLLTSLTSLDELYSCHERVIQNFRRIIGSPSAPQYQLQVDLMNTLKICDKSYQSIPTPPLYIMDTENHKRYDLLQLVSSCSNQEECMQKLKELTQDSSSSDSSPLLTCLIKPALSFLKALFLNLHNSVPVDTDAVNSVLNFCTRITQWPLQSLLCVAGIPLNTQQLCNDRFTKWLELLSTDSHLHSLNSLSVTFIESITDLSFTCLLSCHNTDNDSSVITIENHLVKGSQLQSLLQFLFIHGLSLSQELIEINQDITLVRIYIKKVVTSLLLALNKEYGVVNINEASVTQQLMSLKEMCATIIKNNQQKWNDIVSSLLSSSFIVEDIKFPVDSLDDSLRMDIGRAKAYLGLALVLLLSVTSQLDPVVMEISLYEYSNLLVDMNSCTCQSFDSYLKETVWQSSSDSLLPYNSTACKAIGLWSEILTSRECSPPARFYPESYVNLYEDSRSLLQTLCNTDRVIRLIENSSFGEVEVWLNSIFSAINRYRERYPSYCDLVQPINSALSLLCNGVQELSMITDNDPNKKNWVYECVSCLVQFPYNNEIYGFGELGRIKHLLFLCTNSSTLEWKTKLSLVMVAVECSLRVVTFIPHLLPTVFKDLLNLCYDIWRKADEKERERKKQDESLYRFKAQTHNITGEGDKEEKELESIFPSYESFFSSENNEIESNDELKEADHLQFTDVQMQMITGLYNYLYYSGNIPPDNLYLNAYKLANKLYSTLDQVIVKDFTLGHAKACYLLMTGSKQDKQFNIYKDPLVTETSKALNILQKLICRVNEVLKEWPDYPSLKQIIFACGQVLCLDLVSPLMKVLVGMENVLRKSQDWEAYTCSRLSLSKELEGVTNIILEWRRLELNGWNQLLDICKNDIVSQSSKWWFYINGLLSSLKESLTQNELIKCLLMFMEESGLGEYSTRLKIIKSFSKEILIEDRQSSLGHILENIFCYYEQFEESINEKISLLCTPVEKTFKEFISIVRWKDGNYWSIKQQSERSHRTLMQHMKQYKDILMQSVRPFLSTTSSRMIDDDSVSKLNQFISSLKKEFNNYHNEVQINDKTLTFVLNLDTNIILSGIECFIRINSLLSDYNSHQYLLSYCQKIDELTSDAINEYHALQNDDIPSGSLTKEERQTAIKLVLMKRKTAFTQLFKLLKQLGISYRKGVDLSTEHLHSSTFTTPCLLEECYFNNDDQSLIVDCNMYFFRSVFRAAGLNTALSSPSKDLDVSHIMRMKGYSQELLWSLISQRCTLVESLCNITTLSHLIDRVKVCDECMTICAVNISQYKIWMNDLNTLLNECLDALQSCEELAEMFPTSLDLDLTPQPPSLLPPILSDGNNVCLKHSMGTFSGWKPKLHNTIKSVVNLILKMTKNDFYFLTKKEIDFLIAGYVLLHTFADSAIKEFLSSTLGDHNKDTDMLNFLVFLQQKIQMKCSQFKDWFGNLSMVEMCSEINLANIETVVKSILLDIQHVMEKEKSLKGLEEECDQPLYKLACDFSMENLIHIKSKEVTSSLINLLGDLNGIAAATAILPLLDQYMMFLKRMWLESALAHRTIAKMTSCLLEIFRNVVMKGFCTPPDLLESNESDQFVDQEAGGFDEGEGSKDVSENVEKNNLDLGGSDESNKEKGNESDKNGMEMDEDFNGSLQDLQEKQEEEEEENDGDNDELDKQMGNIGENNSDQQDKQLDKNMWAPEEKQEDDLELNKESGGGTTVDEETQLVAKDDADKGDKGDEKSKDKQNECDNEELINDQDEYFKAGQDPLAINDNEEEREEDFGDININDDDYEEQEGGSDNETNTEEMETNTEELVNDDDEMKENAENTEHEQKDKEEGDTQNDKDNDLNENNTAYNNDDSMMYGIPQTTHNEESSKPNTCNTEEASISDDQCGCEQPNSSSGLLTTISDMQGGRMAPQSNVATHKEEKVSKQNSSSKPAAHSLSDDSHDPPAKKIRLMNNSDEFNNGNETSENNERLENKDLSDIYHHVNDKESCDASTWDSISGVEGAGHQPPVSDKDINEEKVEQLLVSEEYPMINEGHSKDVIHMNQEEENETGDFDDIMEIEKETVIAERDKPTDSFFNSPCLPWVQNGQLDEDKLRESLMNTVKMIHSTNISHDCNQLWAHYEQLTSSLSNSLCEELRLILKPTEKSQLRGDFRSGKRLNLRRIIPYIASNFQNDRIWLKRSKPNKRNYQILLAVDDSSSMNENECTQMAFESLAMVSTALQKLECGQLGVCRFGNEVEILHSFDQPVLNAQGGCILQNLSFSQTKTNFVKLLQCAQTLFNQSSIQGKNISVDVSQLMIILSDGRGVFADGTKPVNMGIQELTEMGVFIVFVILDGLNAKHSIVDIPSVKFIPGKPLVKRTYLETFPFPYYIVLRETSSLPTVLSQALSQWFELITISH